jgi:hypothetical protein
VILPLLGIGLVLWARQNLPVVTESVFGVPVTVTVAQGLDACRTLPSIPGCSDILLLNNLSWIIGGTCALFLAYVIGKRLNIAWR